MLHAEEDEGSSSKVPLSLLQLSDDLKTMLEKQIICNTNIQLGSRTIPCHSFMLCSRSHWFAHNLIPHPEKRGNYTVIMNESDQKIDALLLYIYTGNLRQLESLNIPFIDLLETAYKYELRRFEYVLTRMAKSECPTETLKFLYQIGRKDISRFRFYPIWEGLSQLGTVKWSLEIRFFNSKDPSYVFEINLKRQSKASKSNIHIVCLRIDILDTKGKKIQTVGNEYYLRQDGVKKSSGFLEKRVEILLLNNNVITLSGEMTVSEVSSSMIFQVRGSHKKEITNEIYALSEDMFQIIEDSRFEKIGDNRIYIAGSPDIRFHPSLWFSRLPMPFTGVRDIVDFRIFTTNLVTRSFINFIYSGQTRFLGDYMRDIYCAVCTLQFSEAKIKCSSILAQILSIDNVFGILTDATRFNDRALISAARQFITRFTNDLVKHVT